MLSLASLGLLTRSKYLIQFDVNTENKQIRFIDWNLENTNKDSTQATLKFGGPLEPTLGTITSLISTPVSTNSNDAIPTVGSESQETSTLNAEIILNSMQHGLNKVTLDLNNDLKVSTLNTSANIHGHDYHLSQNFLKKTFPTPTPEYFDFLGYTAHYEDSFKRYLDLNLTHDQDTQKAFYDIKNTLTLTGTPLEGPVVANLNIHQNRDELYKNFTLGVESYSLHFDVDLNNGQKKGDLKHDTKYSESSSEADGTLKFCNGIIIITGTGEHRCLTHTTVISSQFTDVYDFAFNFTNDAPHKTEIDVRVDHVHPKFHADLHTILEDDEVQPQYKIVKTTKAHLSHWPKHHDNWEHSSVSKIDVKERAFSLTSQTKRNSKDNWDLKMDVNWPENLANGDTSLKLVHTCPAKRTFNLDVLNEARQSDIFNNTLTTTWDITGKTKEYIPKKQLTWVITSDDKLTTQEKDKHESKVKVSSDLLLEDLGDGGSNPNAQIFRCINNFHLGKELGKEYFLLGGDGDLVLMGKKKAEWNYNGDLKISQDHQVESTSTTSSMLQTLPGSVFKFESDGWFEMGSPVMRNNTWKSKYTNTFIPQDTRWLEDFEFLYQKLEENSNLMFSVDVNGTKDVLFRDLANWHVSLKIL